MKNNQYLELYLSEAKELLSSLDQSLVRLEKQPNDTNLLNDIFRNCHTLKGNSAAMGYDRVVKVAHALETLLGKMKSSAIQFNPNIGKCLFEAEDALKSLVEGIENDTECELDETTLVEKLLSLETGEKQVQDSESPAQPVPNTVESNVASDKPSVIESTLAKSNKYVRVNLEKLEHLMNAVGELHTAKIRLIELSQYKKDNEINEAVDELSQIVNKLQDQVTEIRLLPLKYILNLYPRLVRDCAHQEKKDVDLEMTGSEIAVDRSILDEIHDPLVHILRNSISHGIEKPEIRKLNGKPERGLIRIAANREKNVVTLRIQDDGKGIDTNKIKAAVLQKGLLAEEILNKLTKQELLLLVTLPGFSLSTEVTERTGRGVGMDVVKNKIEGIGGSFSIESTVGMGTTVSIRLPVSMAIVNAILVDISKEIFAIPLNNIVETLKVDSNLIRETVNKAIIPYREEVLTLIRLKDKLGFDNESKEASENCKLSVVVCSIGHQKVGFIVDQFIGQQEIVIKSLTNQTLKRIKGYSGATILGSGRVAMILDVTSLVSGLN